MTNLKNKAEEGSLTTNMTEILNRFLQWISDFSVQEIGPESIQPKKSAVFKRFNKIGTCEIDVTSHAIACFRCHATKK